MLVFLVDVTETDFTYHLHCPQNGQFHITEVRRCVGVSTVSLCDCWGLSVLSLNNERLMDVRWNNQYLAYIMIWIIDLKTTTAKKWRFIGFFHDNPCHLKLLNVWFSTAFVVPFHIASFKKWSASCHFLPFSHALIVALKLILLGTMSAFTTRWWTRTCMDMWHDRTSSNLKHGLPFFLRKKTRETVGPSPNIPKRNWLFRVPECSSNNHAQ